MIASQDYDELFSFGKCEEKNFDEKIRQFTNPFQILFDILKNDFDETNGIDLRFKELETLKFDDKEIMLILGDTYEWSVKTLSSGSKVGGIYDKICNYSSLEDLINRVLEQRKIGLTFKKLCRCIAQIVSCRNVNQHMKKQNEAPTSDEERDKRDRQKVWWTYEQLFDDPELRKYLPHFVASLYYSFGMKGKISNNDDIESLLQLWKEFPNYAELNEENSITKIMDSLSGRSWGSKKQYVDLQGRLPSLINALKTSKIVTIYGEGGIGKTELVYQALREIDANNNLGVKYDNLLPFTFKSHKQGEFNVETGGKKPVERGIWNPKPKFNDVVRTLAEASGNWKDMLSEKDMTSCAIEYLHNNAIIVVLDNTEVIEELELEFSGELEDFISSFIDGSKMTTESRIIITTRISPRDRIGDKIKMKYLDVSEMRELAIQRAEWSYINYSKGRRMDVNLGQDYDGWENLNYYISDKLSRDEKELVGHPLFVFLCVHELMFENPNQLQFKEIIARLIAGYGENDKISSLFDYITSQTIALISELEKWSPTLMFMIKSETFSEKDIKDSIDRQNESFSSADLIEELLQLEIIRVLNAESFNIYQFKSGFYASNLKDKIESLPSYKNDENKAIKPVDEFNKLVDYISERPIKHIPYILLESRFKELEDRSIKIFDREWIVMTHRLAIQSSELIIDIRNSDSIISFIDKQNGHEEGLINILRKYMIASSEKLCENFSNNPRQRRFQDLVKILTILEGMDDDIFCETRILLFSILSENISKVFAAAILPASLSLVHYLARNLKNGDNLSIFPVNIVKLLNCMVGKSDDAMEEKLFQILSTLEISDEKSRTEILDHVGVICRSLSTSPEYVDLLLEANPTSFFEQMSNTIDVKINNLIKFDIFEIVPTETMIIGNRINFTKDGVEYIIARGPSALPVNSSITCQVFWIGLNKEGSNRVYALYMSHKESMPLLAEVVFNIDINPQNPIKILSKSGMFKLLSEIVVDRITNASKLFGETLAAKLREEDYDFSWSQWKIAAYPDPKEQKISHIISDLSDKKWRVPRLSAGGFNLHIVTSPDPLVSNHKEEKPTKPRPKNLSERTAELRKSLRAKKSQREEE